MFHHYLSKRPIGLADRSNYSIKERILKIKIEISVFHQMSNAGPPEILYLNIIKQLLKAVDNSPTIQNYELGTLFQVFNDL